MSNFLDTTGVTNLWDKIKSYLNTLMPNYIIDRGKTGNWTYIKWSDGTIEAWLEQNVTTTTDASLCSTIQTPIVMADNNYTCWVVGVGTWFLNRLYIFAPTVNDFKVGMRIRSQYPEPQAKVCIYLRGKYT